MISSAHAADMTVNSTLGTNQLRSLIFPPEALRISDLRRQALINRIPGIAHALRQITVANPRDARELPRSDVRTRP